MFLKLIFQYLIFLCEKVIETIIVHKNGCSNIKVNRNRDSSQNWACLWNLLVHLYYCLSTGYEKSILFQWFDCYSSTFALNVIRFRDIDLEWNRDHYCSESGRFNFFFVAVVFFFEATVWILCRRKLSVSLIWFLFECL